MKSEEMNTSLWGLCNRNSTTVIITAQKSTRPISHPSFCRIK